MECFNIFWTQIRADKIGVLLLPLSDSIRVQRFYSRDSRRSYGPRLGFEMKRYLVLAMRKPEFTDAVVVPHLEFLDVLRQAGQLEMTGGFSDKTGGAYVLQADSLAEAQAIADADPLITSGSSVLTVYEWNTR